MTGGDSHGTRTDRGEATAASLASETGRTAWVAGRAQRELEAALAKFEPFNSPHEGLAVIWEEFEELKAHVWANTARYSDAMDEAVQVAAMALRFVHDLAEWGPGYVSA